MSTSQKAVQYKDSTLVVGVIAGSVCRCPLSLEDSEADDWLTVRDLPAHYQIAVSLQLGAYKDSLLAMFPRYVRWQAPRPVCAGSQQRFSLFVTECCHVHVAACSRRQY